MRSSGAEVKISIKALKIAQKKNANKYSVRAEQVCVATVHIAVQFRQQYWVSTEQQFVFRETLLFISNEWVSKKTGKEKCYFNQN
jgi:hypothetical protein